MSLLSLASASLFFVLLTAFFGGSETALTSLNRIALRHRSEAGDRNAIRLLVILENPDRMLVSTLVGINLATVAAATLFSHFLITRNTPSPEGMTTLLLTPLLLIFGEIIPKALFRQRSLLLMQELSGVLELSFKLLFPISKGVEGANDLLLRCLRQKRRPLPTLFVTKAEIKYLVQESEREGILKAPERSLIYQIFELGEKKVGGLTTPLPPGPFPSQTSPIADVIEVARRNNFSRIPVQEARGEFIGFVNLFDVAYEEDVTKPVKDFIRPLFFVQEKRAVDEVMGVLRTRKGPMAIVTDDQGTPKGFVTLEELLGELVGMS